VAYHDRVVQIEMFKQRRQIVGVGVHLITVPGLRGAAVPAPIVRDHAITLLPEEEHLPVPVVGAKRPAMAEYNGLTRAPILVKNLGSVLYGNRRHAAS